MLDMLKTFATAILEKAKTFKGNWNDNNPSSPHYIKNRTHWTDEDGKVHRLDEKYLPDLVGKFTNKKGAEIFNDYENNKATGQFSHAEGYNTIADGDFQHVQGKWNINDSNNSYAHIVGNGTEFSPSNAHTLDWDGNAWFAGDVKVGLGYSKVLTEKDLLTVNEIDAICNTKFTNSWGESF